MSKCDYYMVIGAINNYNYNIANYEKRSTTVNETSTSSSSNFENAPKNATNPLQKYPSGVAFAGLFSTDEIKDPTQNQKYQEVKNVADGETRQRLKALLKSGRLLDKNSNDGTTTLDNLHKIATTPRYTGLDNKVTLKETVKELENPFIITQKFGDIPQEIDPLITSYENKLKAEGKEPQGFTTNPQEYNVEYSSTCPAASMQFNLADKKPAEYARIAAGLTSPDGEFTKRVNYSNISPSMLESLELLKDFNVTIKKPADSWEHLDVSVKPDANAIIRAQVQNNYQDPGERSSVGTLIQSAFMNLASQNAYNSLTDKRYGKFSSNNEGLTEFEKNFLESIMDDEPKISIVYQNIDDDQKLQSYNFDFKSTEDHLLQSLGSGSNVIIGIIEFDKNNTVIGGHEITVIGAKKDMKGNINFICNDTDDDYTGPIVLSSQELIPKIHHAGIPAKLIEMPKQDQVGYQILSEYRASKNSPYTQTIVAPQQGQKLDIAG